MSDQLFVHAVKPLNTQTTHKLVCMSAGVIIGLLVSWHSHIAAACPRCCRHREGRWDDRRPGDRGVDPRQVGGTPQYHPQQGGHHLQDDEYPPGPVPVRRKSHDDLAYKLGF